MESSGYFYYYVRMTPAESLFPEYPAKPLDTITQRVKDQIEWNKNNLETLLKMPEKTFQNFMKPFQDMAEELQRVTWPVMVENSVNNSADSQKIYAEIIPILTEYATEISQDERIFSTLKEISGKDILTDEQKELLQREIREYELEGIGADKKTKKKIKEFNLKLSDLTKDFNQNLINATAQFEYIIENEKDVEGMPEHELMSAIMEIKKKSKKGEEKTKTVYKFTLQAPSYTAYMTYGPNPEIRKILHKAYTTRAPQNAKIIDKILKVRHEKATLLGFKNYAEYSIERKMAGSPKEVVRFLDHLVTKSRKQAKEETQELKKFAADKGQKYIKIYDLAYYSNLYKKEMLGLDENAIKPYFEKEKVVNGMMKFLEKLFGISFRKAHTNVWHPNVQVYDLTNNSRAFARIYMDLETRPQKRSGAWMDNWVSHCVDGKNKQRFPVAYIVGNFPEAKGDIPSLLKHDDVVTLFHEMGHAIHHLFSKTTECFNSGVNGVAWDVVEFPSQFLENFAYDKKVMEMFAYHYQTGKKLPDAEMEKIQKNRNFHSAMQLLRQMEFAAFDMNLHIKLHQGTEIQEILHKIRKKTRIIPPADYEKTQNQFGHIFGGGYAAGYYSYKWAEVYAADAYLYFADNGIFHQEIGKDFKTAILEKGSSRNMNELFREFIGRDVEPEKLLQLNGIRT